MANTTFRDAVLRAVAILGLIAILLLGAWGIIQLAFFISDLVSNAGGQASTQSVSSGHELIVVNVPTTAVAGQPFTISWTHTGGSGNYSYQVSYSCVAGLTFKAPVPTGGSQSVPCDTPFNYTQATSSITLTPVYSGSTDAKVSIVVLATNLATGAVTAQTSGSTMVHGTGSPTSKPTTTTTKPAKTTTTTSSSKAKSTYVASSRSYSTLYGYPDLAVTITSAYSQNGNGTLQFVVQNVGTNVTPANWSFVATLPSGYQYPSAPQQALYPGDKIVYSMGYSDDYGQYTQNPYTYGNTPYGNAYGYAGSYNYGGPRSISVTVDPYNQVYEAAKANNTASASYTAY